METEFWREQIITHDTVGVMGIGVEIQHADRRE